MGAGDGIRTRDIQLGRLALCQLSYPRLETGLTLCTKAITRRASGNITPTGRPRSQETLVHYGLRSERHASYPLRCRLIRSACTP